ncbi:MAG: DUF1559 domain-containing protein, partial [Planctomycetes bacterium]|nr:DUF1559 domain-containing protein [Planctomycetota bacterium]
CGHTQGNSAYGVSSWGGSPWGSGTTTLRYRINFKGNAPTGANSTWDANTILNSEHIGGIHIALADGSARFISENINFNTLARLCSMNDGQPIGQF